MRRAYSKRVLLFWNYFSKPMQSWDNYTDTRSSSSVYRGRAQMLNWLRLQLPVWCKEYGV